MTARWILAFQPTRNSPAKEWWSFYILVVNSQHSPGVVLQINDKYHLVKSYEEEWQAFLAGKNMEFPTHTLSSLRALRFHALQSSPKKTEILTTPAPCVIRNVPGPRGEHRNGALTLQVVEVQNARFNAITKTAAPTAKLFFELSLFAPADGGNCL
jgi:hypothetical protein